jgi:hypothetical protein
MDEEAAGADRLQSLLALRHPVGRIFEMLDLWIAVPSCVSWETSSLSRLLVENSVEKPFVRFVRIGFVGNEDWWWYRCSEQVALSEWPSAGRACTER